MVKDRKAKKFEKYANKQHRRIDKNYVKAKAITDYKTAKRHLKYMENPTEKNRQKLYNAARKKYNTEELMKLQHQRVDDLTLENYRKDKYAGAVETAKGMAFKPLVYADIAKAASRGWVIGNKGDVAKYLNRISDYDYAEINERSKAKAEEFIEKADLALQYRTKMPKI